MQTILSGVLSSGFYQGMWLLFNWQWANLSMAQLSEKDTRGDGLRGRAPRRLLRSFLHQHPWGRLPLLIFQVRLRDVLLPHFEF